jgi:hypothetical protein
MSFKIKSTLILIMLKEQETDYIDSNIEEVFHFLELKGHYNFLIGSNKIRNLLYSNDYDLNSEIGVTDSVKVLRGVYQEFLEIFEKAHSNPEYYIIDFKCGVHKGEPIRWSYEDMKRGSVQCDKRIVRFEECLLMDDNVIKLDLCYLYNDIFTDINCLYNLFLVKNKHELSEAKATQQHTVSEQLKENIKELEKEGSYMKALKRYFSLGIVEGNIDEDILGLLNSDYGIMYKFVSFLSLVIEMMEQRFKPVSMDLIKSNLEFIKQFASHIVTLEIEPYLKRLIKVIKMKSIKQMQKALEKIVNDCSDSLNKKISSQI